MNPYGYIYITTNLVNGNRYIGQSNYSKAKLNYDYLGSGRYLKKAISKYGRKTFKVETIFEAFSLEDLNWAETHFIKEFRAVEDRSFYNVAPGGKASLGFTGKTHSAERNAKLAERFKGHKVSDRVRKAVSETGKRISQIHNSITVQCPHCEKTGKMPPMKRWHFNNCPKLVLQQNTVECPNDPQKVVLT